MLTMMVLKRADYPAKPELIRCPHCRRLMPDFIIDDHKVRCREQHARQQTARPWWNNERD